MTRVLPVGFVNLGRAEHVDQVRTSLELISDKVAGWKSGVLLFNEIDEADRTSPSDHDLIEELFRLWDDHAWESREPILTLDLKTKRSRSRKAARGVARQSPARPLHEVVIDGGADPDTVVIGGHYPAGVHNGARSAKVLALLTVEYVRMQAIHRARIRHHRRAGRHVVWAMDVNWRQFLRLNRSEGTVSHHGPDFIRVIPARGWTAHRGRHGYVDLPIEKLHRFLWAVIEFRPVKHPVSTSKES